MLDKFGFQLSFFVKFQNTYYKDFSWRKELESAKICSSRELWNLFKKN